MKGKKWENEKPTSCELWYLVCCRGLRIVRRRWLWIFTTWYEFPNIRVLCAYLYIIILLNAHKSRKKINTYTRRISKKPQKFLFIFSSYRACIYTSFCISYNIYTLLRLYRYMLAYIRSCNGTRSVLFFLGTRVIRIHI